MVLKNSVAVILMLAESPMISLTYDGIEAPARGISNPNDSNMGASKKKAAGKGGCSAWIEAVDGESVHGLGLRLPCNSRSFRFVSGYWHFHFLLVDD
jgi:hypothetical protein